MCENKDTFIIINYEIYHERMSRVMRERIIGRISSFIGVKVCFSEKTNKQTNIQAKIWLLWKEWLGFSFSAFFFSCCIGRQNMLLYVTKIYFFLLGKYIHTYNVKILMSQIRKGWSSTKCCLKFWAELFNFIITRGWLTVL